MEGTDLYEDEFGIMKHFVLFLIRFHYFLNRKGIRAHGLGRAQQLLKKKFVFKYMGMKFLYLPSIEGSYDYLLIGKSNEPETQTFLDRILSTGLEVNFIDIGASVGEFVISVSRHNNVKFIYAFEPRSDCAEVIQQNVILNRLNNVEVVQKVVGDHKGKIRFYENPGGTYSGIFKTAELGRENVEVESIRLDSIVPSNLENPIMLIDVEGAEPFVLRGGKKLIDSSLPLIIFEYNNTSKKHHQISDIWNILGEDYEIFRLRGDGYLDRSLINTWNCVAVNVRSNFNRVIQPLIKVNS